MSDFELRNRIVTAGRKMAETGLVTGTGGNISARSKRGFLITPSGMDYFEIKPSDIVEVGFSGEILSGERKPSVETSMHGMILAHRRDVNSVVHVHSVYAAAFAAAHKPIPVLLDTQAVMFCGEIPVAQHGPIGTEDLAKCAVETLGVDKKGILLANHGSLCAGNTVEEALTLCESLEYFAKVALLAKILGGESVLSDDMVKFQANDMCRRYGQCGD